MDTSPLISVIIPTHNNEDSIAEAVSSIVNQTYANLEILIVDDNSIDNTRKVAESLAKGDKRIRILSAPDDPNRFDKKLNRNINAGWSARNAGLSVAQGEYITFQDADDVSLLNRLEIQFVLLKKFNATHITTNCTAMEPSLFGTRYTDTIPRIPTMRPEEISAIAKKAKGIVAKLSPRLNASIPFHYKRLRGLNKLFFGTLESYPGAGNSPFFHKSVIKRVLFRPLPKREWPSFMGRGADRDFNFKVAETLKNSYYFDIPLYLWSRIQKT